MYKAVYFDGEKLNADTWDYLKKHKLVFHTPQYQGYDGLPIGNGSFGGMIYHSRSKIHVALNHTDAIDFDKNGNFEAWSRCSEEKNTGPVSCAHLTITDYMPSYDTLYIENYEASLDIRDGTARLDAATPFSQNHLTAFVSRRKEMEVISYKSCSRDGIVRSLELSRWGSRNFFHDYEQISEKRTKNLGDTSSGETRGCIYVMQRVRGCQILTLLYVLDKKTKEEPKHIKKTKRNPHNISMEFERAIELDVDIYIRVLAQDTVYLEKEAERFIQDITRNSWERIRVGQREEWKNYWKKPFIYLPEDDYLENICYLYLYLMNSCSRGRYPITFGSIWCHNHDTRNWGHYYHWNHQQIYWGMFASGKEELCKNYLDFRFHMLSNALKDGKELFGVDGAYFSDIANFNGYQALEPDTVRNLTCGVQIALDFYRYYCYSNDMEFMKIRVYPFMKAVMRLYEGLLIKNKEGVYEIKGGSSCFESYWNLRRTITDRMMIVALIKGLLHLGNLMGEKQEKMEEWEDYQNCIYPIPITKLCETGDSIISAGIKWDGTNVAYKESEYPLNTFGMCQLTGAYPAEITTQGSEDYELTCRTAKAMFYDYIYENNGMRLCGHSTAPVVAAKLGMREDTLKIIHLFIERYQCFANGLFHFSNVEAEQFYKKKFFSRMVSEKEVTDWEKTHEKKDGTRVRMNSEQFRHCYFEPQGEILAAVTEMLMQSHEGKIRLFPSVPESYTATFSLKAEGAHEITSQMEKGEIRYAAVKAAKDDELKLVCPWKEPVRIICEKQEIPFLLEEEILKIPVKKDKLYLIERCAYPLGQYYLNKIPSSENKGCKEFRSRWLGCEQRF